MRILILGATGRTGKWALAQALENGHEVCVLARNIQRIDPQERLTLIEGDPSKPESLSHALADCEAVISVLNISRTSDFPWAPLRTPQTYLSDVMRLLTGLGEKEGVKRIVTCSAWGVGDSRADIPWWFRWTIDNSNIGIAYQDHTRQEEILSASALDWTIVRPVGLIHGKQPEEIRETFDNHPKPGLLISRQTVGAYLVDCLKRDDLIGKKVVISKK
ncbi:MAG: NAD(P)H-binding protein [Bacteroidota bacterium]